MLINNGKSSVFYTLCRPNLIQISLLFFLLMMIGGHASADISAQITNPKADPISLSENKSLTFSIKASTIGLPAYAKFLLYPVSENQVGSFSVKSSGCSKTGDGGFICSFTDSGTVGTNEKTASIRATWSGAPSEGRYPMRFTLCGSDKKRLTGPCPGRPQSARAILKRTVEVFSSDPVGEFFLEKSSYQVNEDKGSIEVRIVRKNGKKGRASYKYSTFDISSNNAAVAGDDYKATSGFVEWGDGEEGARSVKIPIVHDDKKEGDEQFIFRRTSSAGAEAVSPESATITIKDVPQRTPERGIHRFEKADYSAAEKDGSFSVRVLRENGSEGAVTVAYNTEQDTAKSPDDFEAAKGTLRWDDGDSSPKSITIKIKQDGIKEPDEILRLKLSGPDGGALGNPATATLTIKDSSQNNGSLSFKSKEVTGNEGKTLNIEVERSGGSDGKVSVSYKVDKDSGNAKADDYQLESNKTLNWNVGDTSIKTIKVVLKNDANREGDEDFTLLLENPKGGAVLKNPKAVVVKIKDSTRLSGSLGFKSTSVTGDEGKTVSIEVERTSGKDGEASISYRVGADSDSATGNDYQIDGGKTLNWADGDDSVKKIDVQLKTDGVKEGDEQLTLTLENPKGAKLGDKNTTRLTIKDVTRSGSVAFKSEQTNIAEDAGSASIILVRSGGSDGEVSVRLKSGGDADTATVNTDYSPIDTVVRWKAGESGEKSVAMKVAQDDIVEQEESVSLILSDVSGGANIGNPSKSTLIIENTTVPKFGGLSFENANLSVIDGSGLLTLSVLRQGGSDGDVSVQYTIGADGDSAVVEEDFSAPQLSGVLNWQAGDSSAKSIELSILANPLNEDEERLTVSLSSPAGGATLQSPSTAVISIRDEQPEDLEIVLDIISGNQQSGFPGNVLEPFVLLVKNREQIAPGLVVDWTVSPADAGRLMQGASTSASDIGEASNQLEILTAGVITVTAKVNTSAGQLPQFRAEDDPPDSIKFTVNAGFQGSPELTENQRRVGIALDSACSALQAQANALTAEQQDLLDSCNTLQAGPAAVVSAGLDRLAPEEIFAIGTASIDTADIQVTNVQTRINAIRVGSQGLDLAALNMNIHGQIIPGLVSEVIADELMGGAAGDEDNFSRLGVFVNGSFSVGELDKTEVEKGLDFSSQGLTLGADYRLNDNLVLGAALGLVSYDGDFSTEQGSISLSGTSISAFMTWYEQDDAYFDAIVTYGTNDFEVKRRINLAGQADQFAKSKPSATELSISIGSGLDYQRDDWQFGPYGRLAYTQAKVDDYNEKASDPDAAGIGSVLSIESQTLESTVLVLGGQLSKTLNTERGVFIPQLRLELEHRLNDKDRTLQAGFIHDPSASVFELESESIDTDYLNLGTGFSAIFKNGKSGYLFYETRIGQDRVSQHWLKGGLRFEF